MVSLDHQLDGFWGSIRNKSFLGAVGVFFRKEKLRWEDSPSIRAVPLHGLGPWAEFKGEGKMSLTFISASRL